MRAQGSLVLGGGPLASQDDLRFAVQGVYVAEAGRLKARLGLQQPQHAVELQEAEADLHTPDYRAALRAAAAELLLQEGQPRRRSGLVPGLPAVSAPPVHRGPTAGSRAGQHAWEASLCHAGALASCLACLQ